MSRRKGRILAFQALYSYDVGQVPLDELLKFEWENDVSSDVALNEENAESSEASLEEDDAADETYTFARFLISGTVNKLDEIDSYIKKHLSEKWSFERINRVSLAILRISVFALLNQKEIAATIIIDEAIAISKDFGEDGSYKFINAVLDNIKKEIDA